MTGSLPQIKFWRGKRVLVTGHTGFKGTWMCLWLRHLGAEVFGFALPPAAEDLFAKSVPYDDSLWGDTGDVRLLASVISQVERVRPEIVIHMAAQTLVRRSVVDPIETFATNVMGTAHLFAALRGQASVRAVVNVTSDKCYQNNEWVWPYRETDPLGGKDPYSSSKACAELVGEAFRQTYFRAGQGPSIASGRAGNVVGGGDLAQDRLVPDCIRAFQRAEPVVIRNPRAVRPWQHVLEPIAGYLVLAERLHEEGQAFVGGWNFGPDSGAAVEVGEFVRLLCKRWGGNVRVTMPGVSDDAEARLLQLDASKAKAVLGWRPRLDLASTIDWTLEWYQRQAAGEPALALCTEQIRRYENIRAAFEVIAER